MEILNKIKMKLKLAKSQVKKRYLYTLQKPVQDMTLNEMINEMSVKKTQLLENPCNINDRDKSIIRKILSTDLKQNIRNDILINILNYDEKLVTLEGKKAFINEFIDMYSCEDILVILNSEIDNNLKFEIVCKNLDKVPEQILIDFVDPYNVNIDFTKKALKCVSVLGKEKILNKIYNKDLQKKLFFETIKDVEFGEKEKLYKDTLILNYKDLENEYINQIKSKSGFNCLECIKDMEYITPEIAKVLDERVEVTNVDDVINYINNNKIKQGVIIYLCRRFNKKEKLNIFNNIHDNESKEFVFKIIKNDLSQIELNEILENSKNFQSELNGILENSKNFQSTYFNYQQDDAFYDIVHTYSQRFETIANCFFLKFFHIDYKMCKLLVNKYGDDLDELIDIYNSKQVLTEEETCEFNNLLLLKDIKQKLNICDKKELVKLYDEFDKKNSESLNEKLLKSAYCREYVENLYSPSNNQIPYKEIKYNNKNIKVYSPVEFKICTFTVGMFNNFNITNKNISDKDKWKEFLNNHDNTVNACFCTNNNMCILSSNNKMFSTNNICLGFANLHANQIINISPYNLCNNLGTIRINSGIKEKFYVMKNFVANYRGEFNEITLQKNIYNKNETKSIQPSYVVCYNKITDESKKFASDFEIPIVYIDVKNVAKNEAHKLDEIYIQYMRTKKLELLKKFVCEYQNIINGLRTGFNNIMKKYFNPKVFEQKLDSILQDLENGIINKNKHSYECLEILKQSIYEEQKKYEYNISEDFWYNNNIDVKRIFSKIEEIKRKLVISSVEMNNGYNKQYGLKNVLEHTAKKGAKVVAHSIGEEEKIVTVQFEKNI